MELLNGDVPLLPVHNAQEYEAKFDSENPEIGIPPEVVLDQDNDWHLSEHEIEQQINAYYERRG